MMIYIDGEFKCYPEDDGTRTAVEADFFEGKCDDYIRGYRFVPEGETWIREDGRAFRGQMIAPWKPWAELAAFQQEFELQQTRAELADAKAALALLGVTEEVTESA